MEITSKFSIISKAIKEIAVMCLRQSNALFLSSQCIYFLLYYFPTCKTEFQNRGDSSMYTLISTIQSNEKDKLSLYAARHLDQIQSGSEVIRPHLPTTSQVEYNNTALRKLEDVIRDALEDIQSKKLDLIEMSSSDS